MPFDKSKLKLDNVMWIVMMEDTLSDFFWCKEKR